MYPGRQSLQPYNKEMHCLLCFDLCQGAASVGRYLWAYLALVTLQWHTAWELLTRINGRCGIWSGTMVPHRASTTHHLCSICRIWLCSWQAEL
jgi:hypothetical protein